MKARDRKIISNQKLAKDAEIVYDKKERALKINFDALLPLKFYYNVMIFLRHSCLIKN